MANGDAEHEYMDASSNIRHWSTLRFAQLTIYIAITGGLLNVYFGRGPLPAVSAILLSIAGVLLSILFLILQERTMMWWYMFVVRADELEKDLGFRQYSARPPAGLFSSRNAIRLLFALMIIFWVVTLVWRPA